MEHKTFAQKRGDEVRVVADKLQKARLNLQNKKIQNTVRLSDVFVRAKNEKGEFVLQINSDKLVQWGDEVAKQTGKISGVSILWLLEYLSRGLNALLIDNTVVRNIEQGVQVIATTKMGKKHPWMVGCLSYWTVLTILFGSSGMMVADGFGKDDDKEDNKDKKELVDPQKEKQSKKLEISLKTINPNNADFVKLSVNEYWEHIAVGLTELETYRDVSKQHGNEERETNGLGCTWHYKYDEKGVLHRYPNKLGKTKKWTKDYNYDQARRHLIYETMPVLRNAVKDKPNITGQHMVALVLAGYQRPSDMKHIAAKISKAKNDQEVADAFLFYSGQDKWKIGTWKRRWWCAAYAIGAITIDDFLNLSRDGFSLININRVMQNGHFVMTEDVIEYALTVAKSGPKLSVKDFLNSFEEGRKILQTVKNTESKTISFNSAIKQIRQKNARADLMLYGTERVVDKA